MPLSYRRYRACRHSSNQGAAASILWLQLEAFIGQCRLRFCFAPPAVITTQLGDDAKIGNYVGTLSQYTNRPGVWRISFGGIYA